MTSLLTKLAIRNVKKLVRLVSVLCPLRFLFGMIRIYFYQTHGYPCCTQGVCLTALIKWVSVCVNVRITVRLGDDDWFLYRERINGSIIRYSLPACDIFTHLKDRSSKSGVSSLYHGKSIYHDVLHQIFQPTGKMWRSRERFCCHSVKKVR